MAAPALARPGTQESIIELPSGIQLHTNRVQFAAEVRMNEVTGDGDITPQFQHGGLLYVQFRFSGYMVSGDQLGILRLASESNNTRQPMTVRPHNGRSFYGTVVLSQVNFEMQKNSPHVMVSVSGVYTNTLPSAIEGE